MTDFPFESRKLTPDILSIQKIESRIEIAAAATSRSAIAVLLSKYEATVETKSLTEMDGE